jgi:hypothetical protein
MTDRSPRLYGLMTSPTVPTPELVPPDIRVRDLEDAVCNALSLFPDGLTTQELADVLPQVHIWSISPRMAPLERKGRVRRCGERRGTTSNRVSTVWVIA